jgi:hypothetical protein
MARTREAVLEECIMKDEPVRGEVLEPEPWKAIWTKDWGTSGLPWRSWNDKP